jgi:hypothetical protein
VRIRRMTKHSFEAIAEASLIAMLVVGLMAGSAFAGKPAASSRGGSYTATVSPDGPYTFGDSVHITTNAPMYPNNTGPWIWLKCYQDGVVVGSWDHAGFPGGWYCGWAFNLGPTQSWTGGDADCKVSVVHTSRNKVVTDATTSFHVDG